ncbi:MAG: helix-turn-helix transcriptional regulator [Acidobacteriota bacterium]
MNPEFRKVLKGQFAKRGRSMASVSTALGKSRPWLQRLLAGTRKLREDHLNAILDELGVSLEELFAEYLRETSSPQLALKSDWSLNPALILRALRVENDPDLDWIDSFRSLSMAPVALDSQFALHPKVARIDDIREFDRQAALVEARSWLQSILRRARGRRLSPEETAHACSALGVWASIQRTLGRQNLAAKTLELALEVHGYAPSSASWGDLLERTATTVYEFGYPLVGYPLMQQALAIATATNDPQKILRTTFRTGVLAYRSGQREMARALFRKVADDSQSDQLRLAGAISYLAFDYKERSKLQEAIEQLERLTPFLPELPIGNRLFLLGQQANILAELGQLEAAQLIYERILEQCRPHFSPIDTAIALLYLLEILARRGRQDLFVHHARRIHDLLSELDDTPLARDVLRTLLLAVRRNENLEAAQIAGLREQFQETSRLSRQDTRLKN